MQNFFDPFLAQFCRVDFKSSEAEINLLFMCIGIGYVAGTLVNPLIVRRFGDEGAFISGGLIMGLATIMIAPMTHKGSFACTFCAIAIGSLLGPVLDAGGPVVLSNPLFAEFPDRKTEINDKIALLTTTAVFFGDMACGGNICDVLLGSG